MAQVVRVQLSADELAPVIERALSPLFGAFAGLLYALAQEPHLSDETMAAADRIREQVVALGGRDIGPPP
jgi:hypothetical protein